MPEVRIQGFPHISQPNKTTCWYTCFQMMAKYYQARRPDADTVATPDQFPEMEQRYQSKSNPSWFEWRQWALKLGYKPIDQSPTADGIYRILGRDGPILFAGHWTADASGDDGHAVVITGLNTNGHLDDIDYDGPVIWIDDPLATRPPIPRSDPFDAYFMELQQTTSDMPLFVAG
jgi:hypothetical protein